MGEMRVAGASKEPACGSCCCWRRRSSNESLEYEPLCLIVASPPGAKFGKFGTRLTEALGFLGGEVDLPVVGPVLVAKAEKGLGDEGQDGDLVEDDLVPVARDSDVDIDLLILCSLILCRGGC